MESLKIVFIIMLIPVVQLVVLHAVSIDYLRLLALSLAMPKVTVGFTSCSIKLLLPNTTAKLPIQKQLSLLPQILFGANTIILIII